MNISIVSMIIRNLFNDLKKEDFFRRLKNHHPDDDEIERTKEIIKNYLISKMEKN